MPRLWIQLNSTVSLTPRLKKWLTLAGTICESYLPREAERAVLSVLICGDQSMRTVNRTHRGKDKTTDVLSFPVQSDLRKKGPRDWSAPGVLPLGDLLISLPQARRQAKEFSLSVEEEVVHLFFHGFLHLVGHDHETSSREEKAMEAQEAKLLKKFSKLLRNKKGRG
jgi:probable rRNA maturation factor